MYSYKRVKLNIMKKLLLITIFLMGVNAFSQDSIIKKDGSELTVEITEISDTQIKYTKKGFSVAFSLNISDVSLVTFKNGEIMTFGDSSTKEKSNTALLSAGTKVALVMSETISSDKKGGRKVQTGEVISLTVQADVTDVDGHILIKQGTLVNGTITNSEIRKIAGTKGKLSFSVDFIKAVDNQSVPVSLNYDFEGKSKTGVAVASAAVVALPLLLIKGKPAIVKAGQVVNALVVGDKRIKL